MAEGAPAGEGAVEVKTGHVAFIPGTKVPGRSWERVLSRADYTLMTVLPHATPVNPITVTTFLQDFFVAYSDHPEWGTSHVVFGEVQQCQKPLLC